MSGSDVILDQILMDLGLTQETAQEEVPVMDAEEMDFLVDFLSFEGCISSESV